MDMTMMCSQGLQACLCMSVLHVTAVADDRRTLTNLNVGRAFAGLVPDVPAVALHCCLAADVPSAAASQQLGDVVQGWGSQ